MELQTATQLVPLFSNTTNVIDKFAPGMSHDYVVSHEVREGGVNMYLSSFVKFLLLIMIIIINYINISITVVIINDCLFD